jgi:hypothetical protein
MSEDEPNPPESLGPRVKRLRKAQRMSQRYVGEHVGMSEAWVGQVERGDIASPGGQPLERLAALLGTTVDALLTGRAERDATGRLPAGTGTLSVRNRPEPDGNGPAGPGGAGLQPYRGMPVFRYGTVGDPLSASDAPAPHDQVMLKEELVREGARVGPRGWGVLLTGSELSGWRMPDGARLLAGWSVFCNPDAAEGVPAEAWEGRLVIGRDLGGEVVVGQLVRAPDAEGGLGLPWAAATYRAGVPAERQQRRRLARIFGPVVWQQGPGYPESGPDGEGGAA